MTQVAEQALQIDQGVERYAWLADLHADADQGIEHPAWDRPDTTVITLQMGDGAVGALLDVLHAEAPTM